MRATRVNQHCKVETTRAPGPESLNQYLDTIHDMLSQLSNGTKLTTLQVHDLVMYITECVITSDIRRAATISTFDPDDREMLESKKGNWWDTALHRKNANNSAYFLRDKTTKEQFMQAMKDCEESGSGEPGIVWSNDKDYSFNPCISLQSNILTKEYGYITVKDLLDIQTETGLNNITVYDRNGDEQKATFPFKTGTNREVYTVTLNNGRSIKVTDNHLLLNKNGEWKETKDLFVDDGLYCKSSIVKKDLVIDKQSESYQLGILNGWLIADGSICKDDQCEDNYEYSLTFRISTQSAMDYFQNTYDINKYVQSNNSSGLAHCYVGNIQVKHRSKFDFINKESIDLILHKDINYISGFISAMFTCDGIVASNDTIGLHSIKKDYLTTIQYALDYFGIESCITIDNYSSNNDSYKLVIAA